MKYFPFLRGRQTEFLILRDLAGSISRSGSIVPIIEPETIESKITLNSILRCINQFKQRRMPFLLICNPRYGKLSKKIESASRGCKSCIPAFCVDGNTTIEKYNEFTNLYSYRAIAIIYCGKPEKKILSQIKKTDIEYHVFLDKAGAPKKYKNSILKANRVYIRDAFNRRHSNREYPRGKEFFTRMNTREGNPEEINFGDFSIVGEDPPKPKGGGGNVIYTAALHHIHLAKNTNCLEVSHFLSDNIDIPEETSGKINEALASLLKALPRLRSNKTSVCDEYKRMLTDGKSTNVGYMNKLAIKHHLEVMMTDGLVEFKP